jgi:oxepin-CoA hydrolase/3-oxo-5,6-dehydrosuberyl-CoA semialdehyde dehydrogenase
METPLLIFAEKTSLLTQSTPPQWGSMTSQGMIEHLINALRLSQGKVEVEMKVGEREAAILKRRTIGSENPLPKNIDSPIAPKNASLQHATFAEAQAAFLSELASYYSFFSRNPDRATLHPLFGEVNFHEWERFHLKHFTHHFTQFGLL